MKTVVVSAGAVGAGSLAGCGSDSSSSDEDSIGTVIQPTENFDSSIFPQSVASGDPRQSSIILWTRVSNGVGDQTVTVQVATDENFTNVIAQSELTAVLSADHCVKVKVTDLNSYTRYYYRFITDGYPSRTGRFRTAPVTTADEDVKFGFVSCQDFRNGYYNSLLKFLEDDNDDLDFIVHLGDYIYETDGNAVREVAFTNNDGSIDTGSDNAAVTIDQYRDLYKRYRSDAALQRVHERFPFICVWDDHEFSNDSWQDTATFFDGMVDEQNTTRKENSEMAYFEFMPLDIAPESGALLPEGQSTVSADELFPSNVYRGLRFGQRLNLTLTDYRTYRQDHLIPEDGYPGTVVMDELGTGQTLYATPGDPFAFKAGVDATLTALTGGAVTNVPDIQNPDATAITVIRGAVRAAVTGGLPLLPYVDIDNVTNTELTAFLTALNNSLTAINATVPTVLPFSASATPTLKELLIYALTGAYQDASTVTVALSAAEAQAKALEVVDGNLDLLSINGTLENLYNNFLTIVNAIGGGLGLPVPFADYDAMFTGLSVALGQPNLVASLGTSQKFLPDFSSDDTDPVGGLDNSGGNPALTDAEAEGIALAGLDVAGDGSFAEAGDIPPDTTWGFEGFGLSYALLGKTSLSGIFGSRYLVVKSTFDLYNLYQGLILEAEGYGSAWGDAQQAAVFLSLNASSADWNVLGSSVSFSSFILNANEGELLDTTLDGAGVTADDFPRTAYYMNVDHWDGFPLTRATYMNDSSGSLGALGLGTFQDNNVVLISGDIHAAIVTDHSANAEGTGRCLEFTVPGVSSESFGSFTANSISEILGLAVNDPRVTGLVGGLSTFLQAGVSEQTFSPQTMNYVNPLVNGVAIMTLEADTLTCDMHLLDTTADPTLLSTNAYMDVSTDAEWSTASSDFAANFTTVSRTSTKAANGQNGELT